MLRLLLVCSLILCPIGLATAQPPTDPAAAGLSEAGVDKLDTMLDAVANRGLAAGGIAVIERHGVVGYYKAFGKKSLESGETMTPDTIFRIFSMSKPITSAAVMILFEEGKFALDDPIAQYIPDLADLKVGVETKDPATGEVVLELVEADRQPTVRDLLRHTAGLAYGLLPNSRIDQMYKEQQILRRDETLEDKMKRLGQLPLKHQPGTQWDYSAAIDVLGRLVEVWSGQTLDAFFQERIFTPLGMVDTAFHVPADKMDRFSEVYALSLTGKLKVAEPAYGYSFGQAPAFFSGGGGLVSTAEDYLRFCRMLLNRGELNGTRILKTETVDLMTQDHLGELPVSMIGYALGMGGAGFGLGFSVTKDAFVSTRGDVGEYNWGGAASTIFWVDPKQEMIGLYLIQILPSNFATPLQFKKLAYEAIK